MRRAVGLLSLRRFSPRRQSRGTATLPAGGAARALRDAMSGVEQTIDGTDPGEPGTGGILHGSDLRARVPVPHRRTLKRLSARPALSAAVDVARKTAKRNQFDRDECSGRNKPAAAAAEH